MIVVLCDIFLYFGTLTQNILLNTHFFSIQIFSKTLIIADISAFYA